MWGGDRLLAHCPGHPRHIANMSIQIHIKCVCLKGSALVGLGAAPGLRPVLHCAVGSCYGRGELRAVGHFWGGNVSKLTMECKKKKQPKTTETAECFQLPFSKFRGHGPGTHTPPPTPAAGDPIQSKGAPLFSNATASLGRVATAPDQPAGLLRDASHAR